MKKLRVAINGFGRIGRHALKVAWDKKHAGKMEIVAVNDLTDTRTLAHLLKYDTAYPDFAPKVTFDENNLIIGGKKVQAFKEKDPSMLPWGKLGVDVVIESTGRFTDEAGAGLHLKAGAKKVVLSAPGKGEIKTLLIGVNEKDYNGEKIVSNASCTTNCAAPMMSVLEKEFGIDLKNCYHLIRLMRMGKEILTDGCVRVYRCDDADELKSIRFGEAIKNGNWSVQKIIDWAYAQEEELEKLLETTKLPDKPNVRKIHDVVCEMILEFNGFKNESLVERIVQKSINVES